MITNPNLRLPVPKMSESWYHSPWIGWIIAFPAGFAAGFFANVAYDKWKHKQRARLGDYYEVTCSGGTKRLEAQFTEDTSVKNQLIQELRIRAQTSSGDIGETDHGD